MNNTVDKDMLYVLKIKCTCKTKDLESDFYCLISTGTLAWKSHSLSLSLSLMSNK